MSLFAFILLTVIAPAVVMDLLIGLAHRLRVRRLMRYLERSGA